MGIRVGVGGVTSIGAAALLAMLSLTGPATATTPSGFAAPDAGASGGGAVIVVLRNQDTAGRFSALTTARAGAMASAQASVVGSLRAAGGTDVVQLVSVNAVAAQLSKDAVAALRTDPSVAEIVPDVQVPLLTSPDPKAGPVAVRPAICPTDPAKPFLEPEALSVTHTETDNPNDPDQAANIATGKGVIVSIDGMNDLAGNPNFIRQDGSHVVLDSPTPNADNGDDETYGDASSVAAQGTVTYDYSKELPFSGLPSGCTFRIKGIAPGASLVDPDNTDTPGTENARTEAESRIIAGIDNAVVKLHANVISQSFGFNAIGGPNLLFQADDAAVAAGVTVVASSGDSGVSGTEALPAADPNVIGVGATDTLRLRAQADGYADWTSNNIAALSSGGAAANDKDVDLVAPGDSGESACNPAATDSGCPANTLTETFRGTSEAAPIVAGAAADVIQAYSDTHGGARPSPALVKQILTGTATDLGAPADQQGAGLVDVYAAVRAAQQEPGATSAVPASDANSLIPNPSQLDVSGAGGMTSTQQVSLYNTGSTPAKVTGRFRELSAPQQIGSTVTEQVTAPAPSTKLGPEGSPAGKSVTFAVPRGLAQFNADLIIPDPTNSTDVGITLVDPKGRLSQISYSYNADFPGAAPAPNMQHVEIQSPVAGTWTAKFFWNAGDVDLQAPPAAPGSYRGTMSFRVTGQRDLVSKVTSAVTIAAHASASIPVPVTFPTAPGDHPESVQFTGSNGAHTSLPVALRTLLPSAGGRFSTLITSTVGRDLGQLSTYDIEVPAGKKDLDVSFHTEDASANNTYTYYLIDPSGNLVSVDSTPTNTVRGIGAGTPLADAFVTAVDPVAGRWEVDVQLDLTVSGKEFTQTVSGAVTYDTARVEDYGTLPTSTSTRIKAGSGSTVDVRVTNTTGIGRTFSLSSTAKDITGGAVSTGVYLPAGVSGLLTATLTPVDKAGTVASGVLSVDSNSSNPATFGDGTSDPYYLQPIATLPYTYTVG
ncbi:MAG TPA: S8 family serine peptidase [Pseudonocardiaceae bacterium]|nr:S8 family serine peptidase [Pseudonocardiaceae bacterium]